MTSATVKDNLAAANLSLLGGIGDVKVYQGSAGSFTEITNSLPAGAIKYEGGVLTVTLPEVADLDVGNDEAMYKISFKALVDADYLFNQASQEGNENKAKVSNEVTLTADGVDVTDVEEISFDNKLASKKGKASTTKYEAEYEIILNQAQNTMNPGNVLKDKLPEGMILDENSVKLLKLTLPDKGTIPTTGGSELTEGTGNDYKLTYDETTNIMKVELLSNLARQSCLRLKYTTKLLVEPDTVDAGFKNDFELEGYSSTGKMKSSATLEKNSWQGVNVSNLYRIVVKKQDKDTEIGLAGATITLYDGNKKIASTVTKADGYAIFILSEADKNKTFTVEETVAPDGYNLDSPNRQNVKPQKGPTSVLKSQYAVVFNNTKLGNDTTTTPSPRTTDNTNDPDTKYDIEVIGKHNDIDVLDVNSLPEGCTFKDYDDDYKWVIAPDGDVLGLVLGNLVDTGDSNGMVWVYAGICLISLLTIMVIMINKKRKAHIRDLK